MGKIWGERKQTREGWVKRGKRKQGSSQKKDKGQLTDFPQKPVQPSKIPEIRTQKSGKWGDDGS